MKRPNNIEKQKPIDPKLGIKSSLPKSKSTLALVVLLWLSSKDKYSIEYSQSSDKVIKISDECAENLFEFFDNNLDMKISNREEVLNKINQNQLFQSQLEALIVAFELVWKIAVIKFRDFGKADSAERTGGIRYDKTLYYTNNIDLFKLLVDSNKKYCDVLYHWLVEESVDQEQKLEKQLVKLINYLSETAIFKLIDNGSDVIFDMSSVYDSFDEKSDEVDINGDGEAKGALRIIKGTLGEGLNSFLTYKKGILSLSENVDFVDFKQYRMRVKELHRLKNIDLGQKPILDNKVDENVEFEYELISNRIVFGAPGTGKSHRLEEDSKVFGPNVERVTFHPNYSYSQFVGAYKPVMEKVEGKKEISYEYVPGPFMRVYLNAKRSMLVHDEYQSDTNVNVYYEPATDMEHWNLFEEIQNIGEIESFKATKDMKIGDIALIYIGNNDYGYENGVYAVAKVISEPEIDEAEGDGKLRVLLRFDKISYDKPIISKNTFDQYNTQYQSVHRIEKGEELLQDISFGVDNELLIIEEINRANVAAVFGDIFQLLDRKNGVSEYAIATSEDMRQFLDVSLEGYDIDNSEIKIPSNMYIWATMNSADQGVFPMDTAFKRRWEFEYIGIDKEREKVLNYIIPIGMGDNRYYIHWNDLREGINSVLSKDENRVNEDKLLGPFFISKSVLDNMSKSLGDSKAEDAFIKAFESKVIMYLFEDVMKMRPEKIFIGCKEKKLFSKICEAFETDGEKIFGLDDIKPVQIEPIS